MLGAIFVLCNDTIEGYSEIKLKILILLSFPPTRLLKCLTDLMSPILFQLFLQILNPFLRSQSMTQEHACLYYLNDLLCH